MIAPIKKYHNSGELNFKVSDKEGKMKEIKKRYSEGKLTEIDGVRIDFENWWFLVRPSNTESVLRLVIEAENKNILAEKKEELAKIMSSSVLSQAGR